VIYDLKYIVANVMLKADTLDERSYPYLLKHAINGYRKLNLHGLIQQTVKTARIPLDPATNIANLPSDYVDYFKLGVVYKWWDGTCHVERIINIDYNPNIVGVGGEMPNYCECPCTPDAFNSQVANYDPAQYGWQTWLYYAPRVNNGQYTAGIYGEGGNIYRGGFIIDLPNRIIRIGSFISRVDEIVLEYKSTGISDMGNAIVPEGAIPALIAYVNWMSYLEKEKLQLAREHMSIFQSEASALNMRNNAMTEKDFYTLIRQSFIQIPKR